MSFAWPLALLGLLLVPLLLLLHLARAAAPHAATPSRFTNLDLLRAASTRGAGLAPPCRGSGSC